MKHLNLMLLFIGVAIIFSGCSKEDFVTPELNQSDQETAALKAAKVKTEFSGECIFEAPGVQELYKELPNGKVLQEFTTVWHDYADDPLVTGQTTWYVKQKVEEDGTFKYWGKADLIVDDNLGRWEMTWRGYLNQDGLIAVAVGQGKEGAVKGLVAKWTYIMDFDAFVYNFTGSYH